MARLTSTDLGLERVNLNIVKDLSPILYRRLVPLKVTTAVPFSPMGASVDNVPLSAVQIHHMLLSSHSTCVADNAPDLILLYDFERFKSSWLAIYWKLC